MLPEALIPSWISHGPCGFCRASNRLSDAPRLPVNAMLSNRRSTLRESAIWYTNVGRMEDIQKSRGVGVCSISLSTPVLETVLLALHNQG
jgi:hypothetical protein